MNNYEVLDIGKISFVLDLVIFTELTYTFEKVNSTLTLPYGSISAKKAKQGRRVYWSSNRSVLPSTGTIRGSVSPFLINLQDACLQGCSEPGRTTPPSTAGPLVCTGAQTYRCRADTQVLQEAAE
jgi:hypothetical protein